MFLKKNHTKTQFGDISSVSSDDSQTPKTGPGTLAETISISETSTPNSPTDSKNFLAAQSDKTASSCVSRCRKCGATRSLKQVDVLIILNNGQPTPEFVYECQSNDSCANNIAEANATIKEADLVQLSQAQKVGKTRYEKSKKWNARNGYQGG